MNVTTYTVDSDAGIKVFDTRVEAVEYLRNLGRDIAGEVRDSNGKQWACRPSMPIR